MLNFNSFINYRTQIGVNLVSDFVDYYDHRIKFVDHESSIIWNRTSERDLARTQALAFLKSNKWNTVPFGSVDAMVEGIPDEYLFFADDIDIVVYYDEYATNGQGKRVMNIFDALEDELHYNCSLYLPSKEIYPTVYRYYQIGKKHIWVKRQSDDLYMSNRGNVKETILNNEKFSAKIGGTQLNKFPPLFYVDMVMTEDSKLFAIDFEPSPMLKDTVIENLFPASTLAELIEYYIYSALETFNRTEF